MMDRRKEDGIEPHPDGYGTRWTTEEVCYQNKALRIVQQVTGRNGAYDGNICIGAQRF